ncbi:MAG: hypothetical protein FJW38_06070 [Acidobacteria bacterium]|nr:hypothetical protein [Acidobacteriota bacterium]
MTLEPTIYMFREKIAKDFARAVKKFPKGTVVHAKYRIGEDSTGDPAIYFNIVLSDEASRDESLSGVTRRIRNILSDEMNPYDNWGLFPYPSFRSETEYKTIKDPEWTFGVS